MNKKICLSILFVAFSITTVEAQKKSQLFKKKIKQEMVTDSLKKSKPRNKNGIQPFEKVITDKAESDQGLFTMHKVEEDYFYEIPDSLFGAEMLMVTRISKTSYGLGFGGAKQNTQVLRWEKRSNKVLLRVVSHQIFAADSLPIQEAVTNSNFEPVLYSFDIKTIGKDSLSTVIQVNAFFEEDIKAIGFPNSRRKTYKISGLDRSRSFIEHLKSYPKNIESRHVKTYYSSSPPSSSSTGSISIEINNSMILLPKEPMRRRYFDERVGWFSRSQTDYGLEVQKSKTVRYLDRWRLEVKEEDIEKFKRGELVEPKKPIVYYIDRATPKKWIPYIKQGIEEWQVAFEEAGFKNAIIAKDPPSVEEDPEWSPEDVRYSVFRYLASSIPNANGPHVSDPRSGEILESDINWYHNVMTLLRNWYFIQTSAVNPLARKVTFKEEAMGELIRFIAAHEVGHTIGLPHNMASSAAFPVDSLRSKSFTEKFGTSPSIMDYARLNYIAQPEDEVVSLFPKVGVYDKYAVRWGYRPILEAVQAEDEKPILHQWILNHQDDPVYRFGEQQFGEIIDPSSQTEDLGDDAIKASHYGIENLKRILPNLMEWTTEKGKDYSDLNSLYGQLISQFSRYMGHVSSNIGGVYKYSKTYDQQGAVYEHVDKLHQKKCLTFIHHQLFETPYWLINKEIVGRIEFDGSLDRIRRTQSRTLHNILSFGRLARMSENEALNGEDAYTLVEMMTDLRKGIWNELYTNKPIDVYRRNLQRAYIDRLAYLMTENQSNSRSYYSKQTRVLVDHSDIRSVARAQLVNLKAMIISSLPNIKGQNNRYHLNDAIERINTILNPRN